MRSLTDITSTPGRRRAGRRRWLRPDGTRRPGSVAAATRGRVVVALAFGAGLACAPPAAADGFSVWKDCVDDGVFNQQHSLSDYADALANAPADVAEYYAGCMDLIRAAYFGPDPGQADAEGVVARGPRGGDPGSRSNGISPSAAGFPVSPAALRQALIERGLDPAAPASTPAHDAPPPEARVDGEPLTLDRRGPPSLSGVPALPLPLGAAVLAVLCAASLPLARLVARLRRC